MNCATFENELTRLMAGEVPEAERVSLAERLSDHARACAGCAGAEDLLVLMAQPAGGRDIATNPGPAYWSSFDERLAERLRAEEAGGSAVGARRTRPVSRLRSSVAAALALLLAGGLWWAFRPGGGDADLTRLIADNLAGAEESGPPLELPAELTTLLDTLPSEAAAAALGGFAESDNAWMVEPFEPPADASFDPLWAALGDPARASLIDDWLPGGDDPAAGDPGSGFGLALFPDAANLDGAARKELLQWLNEQV